MALRATKSDENGRQTAVAWRTRGMEEVVSALDKSRPSGSLIRNACCEPISVSLPFRQGRAIARNGAYFSCRAFYHFLAERKTCPTE